MLNRLLGGVLVTSFISFPVNAEFISTDDPINAEDGRSVSKFGHNVFTDSDGIRYQRLGNTLKDSNGYSWQIFGHIIRRSDGKSCFLLGNKIQCSSAEPIESP